MSKAVATHHKPNIRHLEIHLTYRCNLRCTHCSNLISQAPSSEILALEKLQELIADSVRLSWPWEWMVFHGGEALLHPQFREACDMLSRYRSEHNPSVQLFLCTNGYGAKVAEGIAVAQSFGIKIENSQKPGGLIVDYHTPLSVSALDTGEDYMLGCFQSSACGIAYTNRGYYECSPAAAAWRVFGYEPMAVRLDDVTVDRLAEGYAKHCATCGYARIEDVRRMETMRNHKAPQQLANPHAPLSKTWQEAVDRYKARKA